MSEKIHRASRSSARRRNTIPKPKRNPMPSRRPTKMTKVPRITSEKILTRSASEPILLFLPRSPDSNPSLHALAFTEAFSSAPLLPMMPPPPPPPSSRTSPFTIEEAKVVVSVTVEGSPGPVRAMVRLGATVDEAIAVVVNLYGKEGRSPKLERDNAGSFHLHHSYFSLQSLNKSDKIGEVGGRSFYLRKSSFDDSFNFRSCEERHANGDSEIERLNSRDNALAPTHLFLSFIDKRLLCKFRRRMRKLWKMVICITCG